MKRLIYTYATMVLLIALNSCKNSDVVFPDYKVQAVYFAYQYPIRTITLGEDIYNTDLDNQHKCQIMATISGVYSNTRDITIGIKTDNALAQGLQFNPPDYNGAVLPMPASYYRLASDKIVIPKGKIVGGVEVQLTDAYFADPLATKVTYVVPVSMTNVSNGDSILKEKNFTLYAIKYINPWTGNYLRRGKDIIQGKDGHSELNNTFVRHNQYVEKDEVKALSTISLTRSLLPLVFKGVGNLNANFPLQLTFDENGNCSVSAGATGFVASGTGKFAKRGEKNSWGAQDRDAIYLSYQIESNEMKIACTDTLVLRDRGVKMETFNPTK